MFTGQSEMVSASQQIIFTLSLLLSNSISYTATCPQLCKCTPAVGDMSESEQPYDKSQLQPQTVGSHMASCWIPSNLPQLQCAADWDILHLQVLNGHQGPRNGNAVETISHPITISSDLFIKCGSVTRLAIWEHSQFTTMPRYILRPLINLTRLIIQVKSLRTIPDHFVAFLPKLTFVMISKCRQVHEIGRMVFEPCPESLQTLWLNSNRLSRKLPAGLFHQCNLRTLWLNDNQLELLDWGSLQGLGNLTTLRLDQNKLKNSLEKSLGYREDTRTTALRSTPMLKSLDLSSNQLSSIDGPHWSGHCEHSDTQHKGLCFLEELNLSNNQLQWLDPYAFKGLPALRILKLEGNFQLYSPDASNGLLIVLYVMGITNKRLASVTINTVSDGAGASSGRLINLCDRNMQFTQAIPRPLKRVLTYFNESNCVQLIDKNSVTDLLQHKQRSTVGVTHNRKESGTVKGSNETLKEVNTFVKLVRRADSFTLFLLCFCMIICGMLLSVVPFTLIACCYLKDYEPKSYKCALTDHNKRKAPIWTRNAPCENPSFVQHAGMPSPEQSDALSVLLRSTRSLLPNHNAANQRNFSPHQARGPLPGHFDCVDSCNGRRVNYAGNVHNQIAHQRFQQANPQFASGEWITRYPHLHQNGRTKLLPIEAQSLLQSSLGTGAGSMYIPAIESTIGGSAYSLVTLTSKHTLSPHTPGRSGAMQTRT